MTVQHDGAATATGLMGGHHQKVIEIQLAPVWLVSDSSVAKASFESYFASPHWPLSNCIPLILPFGDGECEASPSGAEQISSNTV